MSTDLIIFVSLSLLYFLSKKLVLVYTFNDDEFLRFIVCLALCLFFDSKTLTRLNIYLPDTYPIGHLPARHLPDWTLTRPDIYPTGHLPNLTFTRLDFYPTGHLPDRTFTRLDTYPQSS